MMPFIRKIAFIGNSLPRKCGIATFTNDLETAISKLSSVSTSIVAMTDNEHFYYYPDKVKFHIEDQNLEDYSLAAKYLNSGGFDVVCLQHEFGIFGGAAGENILTLLNQLEMPIVTTFHTILKDPNPAQLKVFNRIIRVSSKLVVMAHKGSEMLQKIYNVPRDKIEIIPHGIPEIELKAQKDVKTKLKLENKTVILTFGLLSPNKGIELMIDAMPRILEACPDATYVVLGATHPQLIKQAGETYRESLHKLARKNGVAKNVIFLNQFVEIELLLEYINACDLYVTPYHHEAQMTSGTLAYSFGMGNAVVSTPYWHANELLSNGKGILVPFNDSIALGHEIAALLADDARLELLRHNAFEVGRTMVWPRVAEAYMGVFENAAENFETTPKLNPILAQNYPLPKLELMHFENMCDDTGIYQHSIYNVANRAHGYCVDDNARALLLTCQIANVSKIGKVNSASGRFASFIQHAWNSQNGRFRNFMSFDRRWLEEQGSEDSHGRTLWALGVCARDDADAARRKWATALFQDAYKSVSTFSSPRALAFTLLGLDANRIDRDFAIQLADKLMANFNAVETSGWTWFEEGLSYENARLPQALILTGHALQIEEYVCAGMRALKWLATKQTSPRGLFRPIGTDGFFDATKVPSVFDQQPVEAQASISAFLSAWKISLDDAWYFEAQKAFNWFSGQNDLMIPLVDHKNGACFDGLHFDRANENCGAESVLAYLISLCEMIAFAQQMPRALSKEQCVITRKIEPTVAFFAPRSIASYSEAI